MRLYPLLFKGDKIGEHLKLSDFLASNFRESSIALDSVYTRDDAAVGAQEAIDAASSAKIPLVWDRAVCLMNTVFLGSDSHIIAQNGKGAVIGNAVNKSLFVNKNRVFNSNDGIVDKNITINGGMWNGNAINQTTKGNSETGPPCIFIWAGVENLNLRNHKMFTPKTYCQQAINIVNGLVDNFVADVGSNGALHMDGVHFDGHCNNWRISNGIIRSHDDGIGINADDQYYADGYGDGNLGGFYTEDPCGPNTDGVIENIFLKDSLFGIRLLSSRSRIDRISIRNIKGLTKGYALLLDNYWRGASNIQGASIGNIGTILVDDFDVTTNMYWDDPTDAMISISCSFEELIVTNSAQNSGNVPTYALFQPDGDPLHDYNYGLFTFNGQVITS